MTHVLFLHLQYSILIFCHKIFCEVGFWVPCQLKIHAAWRGENLSSPSALQLIVLVIKPVLFDYDGFTLKGEASTSRKQGPLKHRNLTSSGIHRLFRPISQSNTPGAIFQHLVFMPEGMNEVWWLLWVALFSTNLGSGGVLGAQNGWLGKEQRRKSGKFYTGEEKR